VVLLMLRLAVDSYAHLGSLADHEDSINLAWTLDERRELAVDVNQLVLRELEQEVQSGGRLIHRYMVDDPYGEQLLRPAVAKFFGTEPDGFCLFSGAGVNSLLYCLARLAGTVHFVGDTYPDFPHWVDRLGGRCAALPQLSGAAQPPELVFLERPSLLGSDFDTLASVAQLCERLSSTGGLVLIDESNANYCPAELSAVRLLKQFDNLLVLRGLSKAFGMGALRLGYCAASTGLRQRLRGLVPPLLASSISLRLGTALLDAGDATAPLRARIAEHQPLVLSWLHAAGLVDFRPSGACLPYLLCDSGSASIRWLEARGIRGKMHPIWAGLRGCAAQLFRVSVPLSAERLARLRSRLAPERTHAPRG
jgi:histidinol-phosphate/aromatic aminotransferase/cobyric acid decarboxylase-like protein